MQRSVFFGGWESDICDSLYKARHYTHSRRCEYICKIWGKEDGEAVMWIPICLKVTSTLCLESSSLEG